jgi:outer membrane lipoprotein-sorting protein
MRFTLAALVLALLAPVAVAADEEAKAAFAKMESTVRKAKSFQTEFRTSTTVGKKSDADTKGRMLIAGDKVRIEVESKDTRASAKLLLVSDGKKMYASVTDRPAKNRDAEKQLSERTLASVARAGLMFEVDLTHIVTSDDELRAFDAEKEFPVSGFKFGKKETIGGVETQAIDYTIKFTVAKDPATATVWIDTKTNLPVKRVIVMKLGDAVITTTEEYSKSAVDGKIDEKEFALPK